MFVAGCLWCAEIARICSTAEWNVFPGRDHFLCMTLPEFAVFILNLTRIWFWCSQFGTYCWRIIGIKDRYWNKNFRFVRYIFWRKFLHSLVISNHKIPLCRSGPRLPEAVRGLEGEYGYISCVFFACGLAKLSTLSHLKFVGLCRYFCWLGGFEGWWDLH